MRRSQSVVILYELQIPLKTSYCKPDIIAVKGGVVQVLDLTICDPGLIASVWKGKETKYNTTEVNTNILSHLGSLGLEVHSVQHHPIVVTYNGLMYGKSSHSLKNCGLTARDIGNICVATMMGSIKIYDQYMRGSYTHNSN